jgi:hypothetical protein
MKKAIVLLIMVIIISVSVTGCLVSSDEEETKLPQTTFGSTKPSQTTTTSAAVSTQTTVSETTTTITETSAADETTTIAPTTSEPQVKSKSVTISVNCAIAAQNELPGAPEDGWIITERTVLIDDGDTVFDILKKVCDEEKVLLMTRKAGNAVFVSAIGGITAVNAKSGWMFSVNDEFPMTSASAFKLDDQDVIKWQYTMDSGNDL